MAAVLGSGRVRVLIDYRPALRQRTGVGEYAHQLAAALVPRLGPSGRLVLFSSSWKDRLASSPVPGAEIVDARVPVTLLNLAWHRLRWPSIERFAGALDVAHSMHPLLIPSRTAAQVVTIHDLHFLDYSEGTTAEIRRDYPALAAEHARRADGVIAISEYTARQVVERLGVDRTRITICSAGAPTWRPRDQPPVPGPILFMGTIEPRKNVATLLDAYEKLIARRPSTPPLLLAGGAGLHSEPILARLSSPALDGRARHLGYVADLDREALYRSASLVVVPSLDEGFGLPALEAMTLGVPVVAANRGALPEVLGGAGLLIDPQDSSAIADAIERVLTDPDVAATCATRGIARSRNYSWEASADALMTAYGQAVARRTGRS
jgi:glycosyltransferase involved in cell wall biosynthesis